MLLDMDKDILTNETDTTVMIEFTDSAKQKQHKLNGLGGLMPTDSDLHKGLE